MAFFRQFLRRLVSQNKQRHVEKIGDTTFNLDLTYLTETIICMGLPATGPESLYRNPIDEVARFFRERHQAQGYMIYNCTSECSYPSEPFAGRVH